MSAKPRVAIAGAGPVGSMLAKLLTNAEIPVTVFESERGIDFRGQGGTLDLHPETGLAAMEEAGLMPAFNKAARLEGDSYHMIDKDEKVYFSFQSSDNSKRRPEIDRCDLRKILLDSLPEGTVQWGRKLQKVENGGTLVFSDDSKETGYDLIVGAEGTWSKVRSFITDVKPHYAGIAYTKLSIADCAQRALEIHRFVNGRNVFAHWNGQWLSAQPLGDGSMSIGWHVVKPEGWIQDSANDPSDLEARKGVLLDDLKDWSPQLQDLVKQSTEVDTTKGLYVLPPNHRWNHCRGVTVIGDAAHVMTPYAGEGVNTGLDDARRLAAAIVSAVESGADLDGIDESVEIFEQEMFTRMNKVQQLTHDVTQHWMFSDNVEAAAPYAMLRHAKDGAPAAIYPLIVPAMHTYWFFKSKVFGLRKPKIEN